MASEARRDVDRLTYLAGELDAAYHGAAVRLGLTDSAMLLLYTLQINGGGCPLSEVMRASGLSKQTVNSALRRLESAQCVAVSQLAGGRKYLALTQQGQTLADATVQRLIDLEDRVFSAWPEEERAAYLRFSRRFVQEIRAAIRKEL